jgi:4-hydroxyphenylpyruvate dioxygenase
MNAFPRSASRQVLTLPTAPPSAGADFLPLKGTDHVEFYVGNARQAAYFYRTAFGMRLVAYAGPETGQRDRASYVVQQGKIRFVLTTPLRSQHPIAQHIQLHGDGVRVIALWVDDARQAGTKPPAAAPSAWKSRTSSRTSKATAVLASIRTYGDTIHTFVERSGYLGAISSRLPRRRATRSRARSAFSTSITWSATSAGMR